MWAGGFMSTASDSQFEAIAGGVAIVLATIWSLWEEWLKHRPAVEVDKPNSAGMHQAVIATALASFLALGTVGCQTVTPEQAAYRTLGTIAQSVDSGMKAFGEWVALGKATAADVEKAKALYTKYQAAMRVAKDAALTVKQDPQAGTWDIALTTVEAAAGDLLTLITTLTK